VLVGGLIDTSDGDSHNKIPILGDLPIFGKLFFSNTTRDTSRTELMILINPYVIRSSTDAKAVTKAFKAKLSPESGFELDRASESSYQSE
jgi:general secretion pathway protein D